MNETGSVCAMSKYPGEDKKLDMVCTTLSYFIFLTFKAKAFIFLLFALRGHISCDQLIIPMFSLSESIGKKHYALLKA